MDIWTQSNQGDTTTFWSCDLCGASVQTQDKKRHEEWHILFKAFTPAMNKSKCVRAPKGETLNGD